MATASVFITRQHGAYLIECSEDLNGTEANYAASSFPVAKALGREWLGRERVTWREFATGCWSATLDLTD